MFERPLETFLTLALGGGGATGLWAFFAARAKASGDTEAARLAANAPASLVAAVATLQKELTSEAGRIVGDLRDRIEAVERENQRVIERCDHATDAHTTCEAALAEMRMQLERLTFERPLPPYQMRPPQA